ncbi:MAG TPA: hypothetical protein DCE44_20230, partial [Verrucomicrobiales bacterium]|nr:hypothetical protein [Verrucomicrobiales bacterium]
MNRRILLVGIVVAFLAVLGLVFTSGLVLARWWPSDSRPRIANTAAVVTQIQALSQVVTVKYV